MSQTEIETGPIRVTFHPKASLEGSKPPMVTHANLTEACSLSWAGFGKCTLSLLMETELHLVSSRRLELKGTTYKGNCKGAGPEGDGETFLVAPLEQEVWPGGEAHTDTIDTGTATLKDGRESWDAGKGEGRRERNCLRKSEASCAPR